MKRAHLFILVFITALFSCTQRALITIQYQNQTPFKLDSVHASMGMDYILFQLQKGEKSKEFKMTEPKLSFWGPPFLYHEVKYYSIRDTIIKYPYGNMMNVKDLSVTKVNLINIEIDSSELPKNITFKFMVNK